MRTFVHCFAAALKMLAQERPELATEGEPGDGSAKGGDILKSRQCGGADNNGAVTPGSYPNGEGSKEFLSTGRTGRRNAMPDILGHHADTGTADLSTRLEALTTESVDGNLKNNNKILETRNLKVVIFESFLLDMPLFAKLHL